MRALFQGEKSSVTHVLWKVLMCFLGEGKERQDDLITRVLLSEEESPTVLTLNVNNPDILVVHHWFMVCHDYYRI